MPTVFENDDMGGEKCTKDTSVVFFQLSSSGRAPTVVNTMEDISPGSSECGTPIQHRKTFLKGMYSRQESYKDNNKDSLRVPAERPLEIKLNEQLLLLEKESGESQSPSKKFGLFSPKQDGDFPRSKTLFRFPSLKRRSFCEKQINASPSLLITPVSGTDKYHNEIEIKPLSGNKKYVNRGETVMEFDGKIDKNYDENIPLMRFLRSSGSDRCLIPEETQICYTSKNFSDNKQSISTSLPCIPKSISKKKL